MAELTSVPEPEDLRDIPATTQLLTIAWLRWRMFVNGFRRRSTGERKVASLILTIVLRIIIWPIFAMMAIGPAAGAGFFAYMAIHGHHPQRLAILLAAIVILWQFVAANGVSISAQVSNFDPASLLRFPLRFGRYLILRLLLGLMTPSTIVGCLGLVATAIGIGVADSSLAGPAVVVLAIYAAMNIFFSRMIGVWLERVLASRRAREILGIFMALFFVSFQFFNLHGRKVHHSAGHPAAPQSWVMTLLNGSDRVLAWLPPGFAANAILHGEPLMRLLEFVALLASTALIFAGFAARLHKQFLGEYLAEGAARGKNVAAGVTAKALPVAGARTPSREMFSPVIAACLRKEYLYIRGNGGMMVSLLMPLIFVFILGRGMLADHPKYLLPSALGYAVMGLMAALYNIFGADGTGMQFYMLAPVRLRDVIIAKNIASATLLAIEAALAWCVVRFLAGAPIPLWIQTATLFWLAFVFFANLALGTVRSIQAPRKVAVPQARRLRPATQSKTTALLVLAMVFGCLLLQVPVTMLSGYLHLPWLGAAIFAPLAVVAAGAYGLMLKNSERMILEHRDQFAEELCGD